MLRASSKLFTATRVLDAGSVATSQQPTALDTPLQIEWGPAQKTSSDPVMLSAAGALTINQAGVYEIETSLQFGRTGGTGTSNLAFRALVNGVQSGRTICAKVDNASVLIPYNEKSILTLPAGVVFTWEIIRSSLGGGNNSGGLFIDSPPVSWNVDNCAFLRVLKLS